MVAGGGVDDREKRLFKALRRSQDEIDQWILRSVVTLDFSSGCDTYIESVTFDIDVTQQESFVHENFFYIPISWRNRQTFLEFDCRTNSGKSFQLVPLSVRIKYCEWLFWDLCRTEKLRQVSNLVKPVSNILREHIMTGKFQDRDFREVPVEQRRYLEGLLSNDRVSDLFRQMGREQPLIIRASAKEDISLIKLSQRKAIIRTRSRGSRIWNGVFLGSVVAPSSSTVTFIPPKDCRFRRVTGYKLNAKTGKYDTKNAVEAEIHGGGTWACSPVKTYCETVRWFLEFTGKRSFFTSPASRTAFVATLAVAYWGVAGFSVADFSGLFQGFSVAMVTSYFVFQLRLFSQFSDRSFQFQWALRWQRYWIMVVEVCTLCVPLVDYFIGKIATPVSSPDCLIMKGFGTFQSWIERSLIFLSGGNPSAVLKSLIFLVVLCAWVNLHAVYRYGAPNDSAGVVLKEPSDT